MKSEKEIIERIEFVKELEEHVTRSIMSDIGNDKTDLVDVMLDKLNALQTERLILEWILN